MVEPLLVFVNKASGGHQGEELISRCQNMINVKVVTLPDEIDTWEEANSEILNNVHLRVVVGGGDGTINWVLSLLIKHYGTTIGNFRPPLAAFPLGSGNDFCRAFGWGHKFRIDDVPRLFSQVISSHHIISADMWQVSVHHTDTNETTLHNMVNYFSIGLDAKIANDFSECRNSNPGLFCCVPMNMFNYFVCGCKNFFGVRPLNTYLTATLTSPEPSTLEPNITFDPNAKVLAFQAISSIYGGADMWYSPEARSMDDHLLEVICVNGSFRLGLVQVGAHTAQQIGQSEGGVIRTTEPSFYQIDGEAFMSNGPAEFTVSWAGSYPVIFCPSDDVHNPQVPI